ncbi:MAG TPA: cystathionine gamma-lyase [Longimicrobiales bacterium]|nr:cystathionine gamma-lyase [Longimicrobiales bacterium]
MGPTHERSHCAGAGGCTSGGPWRRRPSSDNVSDPSLRSGGEPRRGRSPEPERASMREATRIARASLSPTTSAGAPLRAGPTFASMFHLPGDPHAAPYQYGRYHNPTWSAFEDALAELEGGPATVFSSGMAAVFAVFETMLAPGDTLVMTGDGYYAARTAAERRLPARGVRVRLLGPGEDPAAVVEGSRLVWLETPSNPALNAYDIARTAEAAHAAGALLVVDNTTPTVAGQRPLALGADLSLASDTKALTGHGDLVLGHVAAGDPALSDALRAWRSEAGAIPGPMEVWLAHRSLATLDVRLERMCANALAVAEHLAARDDLVRVRYPGLPNDPAHEVASRQMTRYGPVVSFELPSARVAETFLEASELVTQATSFGGLHTTGERRARWGGDAIGEGFVRLSVGCEDPDDLREDLTRALDRALA